MDTIRIISHKPLLILLFFSALSSACLETYEAPELENIDNILVVEGIISDVETYVRLSRTQGLQEANSLVEAGATVTLESESTGNTQQLSELAPGYYSIVPNLVQGEQYRIRISTGNKVFASEYLSLLESPEIDSISWSADDRGIEIYANTHDPLGNTRYYRWEFEETWEYRANFFSLLKYEEGEMVSRLGTEDNIYSCWQTESSSQILVGSSVQLAEDVISEQPLVFYEYNDAPRLSIKYSILVKQYALTKEAYEFWEILKKNSEDLGTFFDPQPSQLPTNINCLTDAQEPVIGFISASTVAQERRFILNSEFEFNIVNNLVPSCSLDTIGTALPELEEEFNRRGKIPITEVYNMFGNLVGYEAATRLCGDCRTRGGTSVKPDFW